MDKKTQNKVRIIEKTFESIKKDNKGLANTSLLRVAEELSMPYEELTSFFLTVEDVYFNEQERSNRKIAEFLERGLSEVKTANDAKYLFEELIRLFVRDLPEYADVIWAATPFLPKCLKEKIRMKAYLKKNFKRIIKKGWPGKIESVLDRQTDLVILSFYGLYEYCARTKKKDRKAILEDFINMLNLHLQDRLFF
jgi:hypothetical protein|tara:strand:- start:259 stop:843 length:585 start_codon:yes stop_codon:yes gene_type:complete